MAHSKRRSSPARVVPFQIGHGQVSEYGNKAIRLFMTMVAEGVIEEEAWEDAGHIAFRLRLQDAAQSDCHLVSPVTASYTGDPRNGNMTKTATKNPKKHPRKNTFDLEPGVFTTIPLPAGEDPEQVLARGIARFANTRKMTIPKIAAEHGLNKRLLYRLLHGDKPQTAAANFNKVATALGMTRKELEALGAPPP